MTNDSIQVMTTAEVAAAVDRSVKTVTRWVDAGRITPIKRLPGIRGAMFFDAADVANLVERAS